MSGRAGEGVLRGVLESSHRGTCIRGDDGAEYFSGEKFWRGYLVHWTGARVCARRLPQVDYDTGKRIIIVWPSCGDEPRPPYMELYYNERLVKYPASIFGHNAININGTVFNFSHLINENEAISEEEYLYRPALGEFAPSPDTGRFSVSDRERPYYDKFGRNFMRTIHVLHVEGIDTVRLMDIFSAEIERIRRTPPPARRPDKYRDFHFLRRSCTTIIRDGLRRYGFSAIRGVFPRDMFVSAVYEILGSRDPSIHARAYCKGQLKVDESPYSAATPLLNPLNACRARKIYGARALKG